MLRKIRKGLHLTTSVMNHESEDSVSGGTGGIKTTADGTGRNCPKFSRPQLTISGVVQLDPWLSPFKDALRSRYSHAQKWIKTINDMEGGLEKFSRGHEQFGFNAHGNGDITYREWAPNALRAYLIGDFSTICSRGIPSLTIANSKPCKMAGIGRLYQ